jgi:hydroxymethylpyrimidine pyrophosphatase-like HAD family hydrolase
MRYIALAVDYDGTLASHGRVTEAMIEVLEKVKASGRKLILVTGRHLPDLQNVFPRLEMFDRVVAENGALLYDPATREEKALCDGAPDSFVSRLRQLEIPFTEGCCIVATQVPYHVAALDVIRELGLDLQVIFNKGAVMILPSGVNNATGLRAALNAMQLSLHNTVAIGDGENDHALLSACECGVAVANAVPTLKEKADIRTAHPNGGGVTELIEQLLHDDLAAYDSRLSRHAITVGMAAENHGRTVQINQHRNSVLVAGPSSSGKSTAVGGILEQFIEQGYQFCVVDPEGDFDNFADALSLGTAKERPSAESVMKAIESPDRSTIVNLMALPVSERPEFLAALLPRLLECRAKTARPHWIVIDEAHHLLPTSWSPATTTLPQALDGTILVTVHPEHVSIAALRSVDTVIATGTSAGKTLAEFATRVGISAPPEKKQQPQEGQALVWCVEEGKLPILVTTHVAKAERRRHRRNYAEGELPDDRSFYFRGPQSRLRLRAHNLMIFLQIAEGVDDDTWLFHLRRGDYSRWFEEMIKDPDLAKVAFSVEKNRALSAQGSRQQIREAVESRYTKAA